MPESDVEQACAQLLHWCRERNFEGFRPCDGLNRRIFQATPLKNARTARLIWTQFLKRSPINFRPLVRIAPSRNAKAMALFALAALANFQTDESAETEGEARDLLGALTGMSLKGFKGAAWGYNFDWQGRAFFAPQGTPTIVPTAFAARALVEAGRILDDQYL